jgi:hypothetical protein
MVDFFQVRVAAIEKCILATILCGKFGLIPAIASFPAFIVYKYLSGRAYFKEVSS